MSEMSAEKKKEIEKYIIKSYFGGGKNVESLANGADAIKGTDDGYIPQLIVEVTYFGESGVVMIKWNIYGDSQQNSFAMHICREREIERNRCDSVDSMMYAWEAWRAKIQGKPIFSKTNDEDLQKDKRIEELEREIKALEADLSNEYDSWRNATGCISPEEAKNTIKDLKDDISRCTSLEQEVKILSKALQEWKDGTGCPSPSAAKTMIECMASWHHAYDDAQKEIESLKKALRASNSDMQKELDQEITKWQDATGRIEPEGAKQYIERLKGRLNKIHDCAVDW